MTEAAKTQQLELFPIDSYTVVGTEESSFQQDSLDETEKWDGKAPVEIRDNPEQLSIFWQLKWREARLEAGQLRGALTRARYYKDELLSRIAQLEQLLKEERSESQGVPSGEGETAPKSDRRKRRRKTVADGESDPTKPVVGPASWKRTKKYVPVLMGDEDWAVLNRFREALELSVSNNEIFREAVAEARGSGYVEWLSEIDPENWLRQPPAGGPGGSDLKQGRVCVPMEKDLLKELDAEITRLRISHKGTTYRVDRGPVIRECLHWYVKEKLPRLKQIKQSGVVRAAAKRRKERSAAAKKSM